MLSNQLILCCPVLLLPSIFPSIRVFSNNSALHIRWPKYWSCSFSINPSNEYSGLISFRTDWLDLLAAQVEHLLHYVCAKSLCHVWSFATLWTIAHLALSMGFSRQESWSGVPFPTPGNLPDQGIEPTSLTSPSLAGGLFTTSTTWRACKHNCCMQWETWVPLSTALLASLQWSATECTSLRYACMCYVKTSDR